MSKKQKLDDSVPLPGPLTTVLGQHVDIEGDVIIDGDVMLCGRVSGSLYCKRLVLDRDASVEGVVVADVAAIWGTARADIYAPRIELHAGCDVEGAAYHEQFFLDKDAYFEGKSRRFVNPQTMAPAA